MTDDPDPLPAEPDKPRHTWPWFVLGAVVLAILLAVAWMSQEVQRARRVHDLNAPAPQTGPGAPNTPLR